MDLEDSVTKLPSIGYHYALLLEKIGIKKISDLLSYIPYRYLDFTKQV